MLDEESVIKADAKNRAWRTLIQNLAFDVGAAVALVLYMAFDSAQGWSDIQWGILGFTLVKTVVVSALSYLMRRVFKNMPVGG